MIYDIMIIGGGINGVGVAAEAAGRGLSVLLAEQYDFGSGTSSKSSKLIHGGLRYLQYGEFRLVRKALKERQTLLSTMPELIHPLQFIIPKSSLFYRLGLWCYDLLSWGDHFPRSKEIKLSPDFGLHPQLKKGLSYYDAQTNDLNLVLAKAEHAKQHGATLLHHHRCTNTEKCGDTWNITLQDKQGQLFYHQAKVVVNTTGPWLYNTHPNLQLVKGSHIRVKKFYPQDWAYLLPQPDGRIVFVMPYEGDTLIGTTEIPFKGDPSDARVTSVEIDYLAQAVARYFVKPLTPVISGFAGVRALYAQNNTSMSAMSRDYHLAFDNHYLTVFGGKLTTFRILGKEAVDIISQAT